MRVNFDEIRTLFKSKFLENSANFCLKFHTFDIRKSAKFRRGHRNIEEAKFGRSEISTKIRTKLNAIPANFRKIDDAKFRTNEKEQ